MIGVSELIRAFGVLGFFSATGFCLFKAVDECFPFFPPNFPLFQVRTFVGLVFTMISGCLIESRTRHMACKRSEGCFSCAGMCDRVLSLRRLEAATGCSSETKLGHRSNSPTQLLGVFEGNVSRHVGFCLSCGISLFHQGVSMRVCVIRLFYKSL